MRDGEADFENADKGNRKAMPFASLTAARGNRVIVDDPHSTETAEFETMRERARRIFRESVTSRLNDPKRDAIVVIMHRLHQRDLCGLIDELGLDYVKLTLPMEFEKDRRCITPIFADPRQQDGELLFPERFSRETVERDKKATGRHAWAGQYQQRPAPREGSLFRRHWFGPSQFVTAVPANTRWVRHWDLAASVGQDSQMPWTVGLKLGRDADGVFYVADIQREQLESTDVRKLIAATARADGPNVEISLPQDPGQAGKAQARDFITLLAGYNVHAEVETGSKEVRAAPVAAQAEAGNLKLVVAPWNEAFLDELYLFPGGALKDQVDALSGAFARLCTSGATPQDWVDDIARRRDAKNNPVHPIREGLMDIHNLYLDVRFGRRQPDSDICSRCGEPLIRGQVYTTDGISRWHPQCPPPRPPEPA